MKRFYHYKHPKAEILVFDHFLISQIQEGVNVGTADVAGIKEIVKKHFNKTPWIYISNRTVSYSVDPMIYKLALQMKNLRGVAIVTYEKTKTEIAKFEQKFSETPTLITDSITKAMFWGEELCN